MRSITEISNAIKEAFIADETLQAAYSLDSEQSFDDQFPSSSVEAHIINVIASSVASVEFLWDQYKNDVNALILSAYPGTVAWYHNLVKNFEYGAESDKIIKYVAIVEEFPNLIIKVNGEDYFKFAAESDHLTALYSYLQDRKFAGTQLSVISREADDVDPICTVYLDASKFNSDGENLVTEELDVENAIDAYLANIIYNGTFNKTKLVDAILAVDGVVDVELDNVKVTIEGGSSQYITGGNNYQSYGGAFKSTVKTITYVLT